MKVYEEVSEEVKIGNSTYLVEGSHRDWNPLSGTTPPEGTVWELTTDFVHGDGVSRQAVGAASTKAGALLQLAFMIGFKVGVDAVSRHL